jgi:hypothetical protein
MFPLDVLDIKSIAYKVWRRRRDADENTIYLISIACAAEPPICYAVCYADLDAALCIIITAQSKATISNFFLHGMQIANPCTEVRFFYSPPNRPMN